MDRWTHVDTCVQKKVVERKMRRDRKKKTKLMEKSNPNDISYSMAKQEAKHTLKQEKTSILCHPNVETVGEESHLGSKQS
ncbi:hypothetical protein H5410_050508 [Solanum commersonii]|uniref:Uncharacterized protein n=1 Tax=Solanum commersonii TaxID=4109 RepID=A0A9J5WVN2_SOLCO|nr:hypothetical protein H5410_050508 [Solanum commersonii]